MPNRADTRLTTRVNTYRSAAEALSCLRAAPFAAAASATTWDPPATYMHQQERRQARHAHQRLERLGWPAETTATRLRAAGLAAAASAAAAAAPWLKRSGGMTVPASLSMAGRVRLLRMRSSIH